MTIEITSRHFSPSEKLQKLVNERVSKIERYSSLTNCFVILEKDNTGEVVEIKAHSKGHEYFAQENSDLFEKSLTVAVDKIITQMKKHSGKANVKLKSDTIKFQPES